MLFSFQMIPSSWSDFRSTGDRILRILPHFDPTWEDSAGYRIGRGGPQLFRGVYVFQAAQTALWVLRISWRRKGPRWASFLIGLTSRPNRFCSLPRISGKSCGSDREKAGRGHP